MGGYNRTFFAAVWQPKFYLVRHPPAVTICQLRQPENMTPRSMREWSQIAVASSIAAVVFFPTATIDEAVSNHGVIDRGRIISRIVTFHAICFIKKQF